MKIIKEGQGLMVLKDNNYSHYLGGLVFFAVGLLVVFAANGNLMAVGIGALFAIIGVYIFISNKAIEARIDKISSKFSVSMSSLLKGREYKEFSLGQVKELVLRCFIDRGSKGSSYYQFALDFKIDTGEVISLEFGRVGAGLMDAFSNPREKKRMEAKQVAVFLGLPLKEESPLSLGDMMNLMKQGGAQAYAEQMKKQGEMDKT